MGVGLVNRLCAERSATPSELSLQRWFPLCQVRDVLQQHISTQCLSVASVSFSGSTTINGTPMPRLALTL